jgi:hypothetical protein
MTRVLKPALVFALSAFAIGLSHQAASAGAPTVSASPNPYKGNCPTTLAFTGTITATAAGTISYQFAYTAPGQSIPTLPKPQTVVAKQAGPVTVTASGNVTWSGTGTIELDELAPVKAHSQTVTITTVCSSSTAPNYPLAPSSRNVLTAPKPLTVTQNQKIPLQMAAYGDKSFNIGDQDIFVGCGGICAGYEHYRNNDPFDVKQIIIYRGYLLFNKIPTGQTVVKAVLGLNVQDRDQVSCFGGVGAATSAWNPATQWPDGDFSYATPMQSNGTYMSIDVTSIVRAWMTGKVPQYGLVVRGSDENTQVGFVAHTSSCIMQFAKPNVLYVQTSSSPMAPH